MNGFFDSNQDAIVLWVDAMVLLSVVDRMLTGSGSEICREREAAGCTDSRKLLLLTRATILVLPLTVNLLVACLCPYFTYFSLVW